MRVEYINPFVEAAFGILKEVLAEEVTSSTLYLKAKSQSVLGVAIIIGLAGDVEGRVLWDMSENTALGIASKMNNGKLNEFEVLAKATISELANMITAHAITKLHEAGFDFKITSPAIVTGENMQVSDAIRAALIVPIETPYGKMEIDVALQERS